MAITDRVTVFRAASHRRVETGSNPELAGLMVGRKVG